MIGEPWKTNEIRKAFLDFFKDLGHEIVPSAPLVPLNDKTLLFTNAGMVPFKDIFLGLQILDYKIAASSQCCIRAGGKHNDLENVGFTARHHTFFEMLGNFSFGAYFKAQAIQYAWTFLTQCLKLPAEKLWITVYQDDLESEKIWLNDIKISPKRFSRCGEQDNFWSMGETGPCGPCSEIFYDHGADLPGDPPGGATEGLRFVEIWNLVFMQYNRDKTGNLVPLSVPAVDTGMGLERISAVMQGVYDNYEIDLFQHLISATARCLAVQDQKHASLKVIVDHLRSCAFLVAEGVLPGNEGRGYVLRRILRRAIRHGQKLGSESPFFYRLVSFLVQEMGTTYPILKKQQKHIEQVFLKEEQQFEKTLKQGLTLLEDALSDISGDILPGDIAFTLYDTYGFPIDLTETILQEQNKQVDKIGFEREMAKQRARAKKANVFSVDLSRLPKISEKTVFVGYDTLAQNTKVTALYTSDNQCVEQLAHNETGMVILAKTPFYAESGGQVGDKGEILFQEGIFEVTDTQKQETAILHIGKVILGDLKKGQSVQAKVNQNLRQKTVLNHTATHLLHAVLRAVLGTHVVQKGSLVDPDKLRFDFSHEQALTPAQLETIEDRVNDLIRENSQATIEVLPIEKALASGAIALFGEKYDQKVRVLKLADGFSVELCGGTHVKRTGDIGFFKILSEGGIAAGVRRIEAVTGDGAIAVVREACKAFDHRIEQLQVRLKAQEKKQAALKQALLSGQGMADLLPLAREIQGVQVLSAKLPMGDPKTLRALSDKLKHQLGSAVVVLGVVNESKVNLIASITQDLVEIVKANDLVREIAHCIGGRGGGRADMAQAGGNQPEHLDQALDLVWDWVEVRLKQKKLK